MIEQEVEASGKLGEPRESGLEADERGNVDRILDAQPVAAKAADEFAHGGALGVEQRPIARGQVDVEEELGLARIALAWMRDAEQELGDRPRQAPEVVEHVE